MRITKSLAFILGAGALVLLTPPPSEAQTFPTSTWQALTRNGTAIGAAANGANQYEDIVGTASAANAAAYVQTDATYMYFRVRINGDPKDPNATQINATVYGCLIDTDGDAPFELIAAYDGNANKVSLRHNSGAATDTPNDIAGTLVDQTDPGTAGSYPTGTFGKVSTANTSTSSNNDYFVDFAIPRDWLRTYAGLPTPDTKTLRFACGTGQTTGALNLQLFDPNNGTLSAVWSDPVVCGNSGCSRDQDSDGVIDTLEDSLGTDKTKKDTDGDGINDNVELSASGSTGPYTGVDTDGDGTIDAKDTDSDNDCRTDASEPGTYRTKIANPSSVCGAATPVCNSSTGTCTVCSGPNGSGGNAPCPTTTAPACQANGTCTQCRVGQTTAQCTGSTPACSAAGACVQCNGDNGDAIATHTCPTTGLPGCVTSGAMIGQCKICSPTATANCTSGAAPACDATTYTCVACNGDRGSGTTRQCPTTANPVCNIAAGTCGTCTSNADCSGAGHAGPTCEIATGKCFDTDSDGDGLDDSVEINIGTNPFDPDSDDDGINDKIEATPNSGGLPTKVDTDGDGTIDALDIDSDNDTVLDKDEGVTDTDGDSAADYRDPDDDGDTIPTSIEVVDGKVAKVSEDVDNDGKKNWLDKDSNGDGVEDGVEARGDEDSDGIPDYLDTFKDPPKVDPPDSGTTSSSGGNASSSGFTVNDQDAGAPPPDAGVIEEGVVEGTGLFCGRSAGGDTMNVSLFFLGALSVIGVARRRRR